MTEEKLIILRKEDLKDRFKNREFTFFDNIDFDMFDVDQDILKSANMVLFLFGDDCHELKHYYKYRNIGRL